MSDRTGAVFDLGYKPYTGDRLGRAGAIRAIIADGVRRVLGLRRKARKKVYPWSMVGLAIVPAAVFGGLDGELVTVVGDYGEAVGVEAGGCLTERAVTDGGAGDEGEVVAAGELGQG